MKTKREVLERFAEKGYCSGINCSECAYLELCGNNERLTIKGRLQKIGAMAILKMFREKENKGNKLEQENKQLKQQIEKMKCCGNCKHCDSDNPCRFHRENRQCDNYGFWELAESEIGKEVLIEM